jgi:predicted XRE-type DNA-binding protein
MVPRDRLIARTADELAEILDIPAAELHAVDFRLQVARRIGQEVARRQLTHAQAAKLAETSRSRMTAILNGNIIDISADLLLRVLASLGLRAKVTFTRAA